MKRRIILAACLSLAACGTPTVAGYATSPSGMAETWAYEVTLPDGSGGWNVTCTTANSCMWRATQLCPQGFQVLDEERINAGSGLVANQFGVFASQRQQSSVYVRCQVPRDE